MGEEEEVPSELKQKINDLVEKSFNKIIDKAASGSIEELVKTLITDKIAGKVSPLMKRFSVKLVAKKVIRKSVDRYWENNRETMVKKIKELF
jgi:hypothetical protein